MSINYNQRVDKRYKFEATMWHDDLFPEVFYETKIYNLSKRGIYFESDQALYVGEKIYIAIKDPSESEKDYKDCVQVEIKWRKKPINQTFQYGYGAKFIDFDNTLAELINMADLEEDNLLQAWNKYRIDSRQNLRTSYRKVTFFITQGRNYKGFITNISRSGAFIVARYKFTLGQAITLIVPEGGMQSNRKLKGSVVRLSPKGAGLKFDRRTGMERRKGVDRRKNDAT